MTSRGLSDAEIPSSPWSGDPVRASARRASIAATDLFLSADGRLSDRQRALAGTLIAGLVDAAELELRQYMVEALLRLPVPNLNLQNLLASDVLVSRVLLEDAGLLRDEELVALVIRRVNEHRISTSLKATRATRTINQQRDVLVDLLADGRDGLAKRSMELLIAESRRLDRFGEPLLTPPDLAPTLAARLFWRVAAAIRACVLADNEFDKALIDRLIIDAAHRALQPGDSREASESRAMRLAHRMMELGLLTDMSVMDMLSQSRVSLFVAALSVRAGVSFEFGWAVVADPDWQSLLLLVRAIGMDRSTVASLLLALDSVREGGPPRSPFELNHMLDGFDALDPEQADEAIAFWRLDRSYREAIGDLNDATQNRERSTHS